MCIKCEVATRVHRSLIGSLAMQVHAGINICVHNFIARHQMCTQKLLFMCIEEICIPSKLTRDVHAEVASNVHKYNLMHKMTRQIAGRSYDRAMYCVYKCKKNLEMKFSIKF